MYPGFVAEYEDRSAISTLPVKEVRNKPLFGAVFTSDKGTEQWTRISGKDFFDMYGKNISFARHGQPLLQAAMSINAGAELLCKRLVANDATLANVGIIANVTTTKVQAKDEKGNPLYLDESDQPTVEVTQKPYQVDNSVVSYKLQSAEGVKTLTDAAAAIKKKCVQGDHLLYVIGDIGRGTSKKRIKIIPDYRVSKSMDHVRYTLKVLEGDSEVESMTFSVDGSIIINDSNVSLQSMIRTHSTQLTCIEFPEGMDALVDALSKTSGLDARELYSHDVLFGCKNSGEPLPYVTVNSENVDLRYTYGQTLASGTDGAFATYPTVDTEEFKTRAIEAFNGEFDTVIFNMDQHKLDAIVDANYPVDVKRAIEALAVFREDFVYLRDQGLGKTSLALVEAECAKETKSMFCATYCQSYDIIDPYTKRQIPVTIGYDLAQKLVYHIDNGRSLPTAGIKYKMTIDSAIYGTLSFSPTICPTENQKEKLEDMRVNYASYIDNSLVVESLYTSQEKYSQWSFLNNVMGIQEVIKAIRTRCPAIRYTFIEGQDLETYKSDVEEVIAPYRNNFSTLELDYVADATYSVNKIFYAVLNVAYKNFIQSEVIKVVALSAADVKA